MQLRSTIMWRGAGYGMAASAGPFAILTVISVCKAITAAVDGARTSALLGLAWGVVLIAIGAALGLLPGLAVGVTLALSGQAPDTTTTPRRIRAALAAGAAFLGQLVLIAIIASASGPDGGGIVFAGLLLVGTPVAAALAGVLAKHIQGSGP